MTERRILEDERSKRLIKDKKAEIQNNNIKKQLKKEFRRKK